MHVIVVHSLRFGGVGKTTISFALARRLAEDVGKGVIYITSEPQLAMYYDVPGLDDLYNVKIVDGRVFIAYMSHTDLVQLLDFSHRLCQLLRDKVEIAYAIFDMPANYVPTHGDHVHVLVMKPLPAHAVHIAKHVDARTVLVVNMVQDKKMLKDRKRLLEQLYLTGVYHVVAVEKIRHNFRPEEEHVELAKVLSRKKYIGELAQIVRELLYTA